MRQLTYAFLGLALLGLSACGGDSDEKDHFIAEANSICTTLGEDSSELADESIAGAKPTRARLERFDDRSTQLQLAALMDLRALTPPEGDEQEVTAIWDALEQAISELDALGFDEPGEAGGPADQALTEFGEMAGDYGLDGCAQGI